MGKDIKTLPHSLASMKYDLSYTGKKLKLKLSGDDLSATQLKSLLQSISLVEQHVSESELRTKVVRQLKTEILSDGDVEDLNSPGWWDIPQDLVKHKEAGPFLAMEADLNQSLVFEKASFSLKTVITDTGKQFLLDRDQVKRALQKLSLQEKFKQTKSVLVRVKGAALNGLQSEVEDFLRTYFPVDRLKVVFENKKYGDRASLEIILFGDFLLE